MSERSNEVMRAILDALDAEHLPRRKPPTDDEIRATGERAALALAEDPRVLRAVYNHADCCVDVTLTGEAMGFPLTITVDNLTLPDPPT